MVDDWGAPARPAIIVVAASDAAAAAMTAAAGLAQGEHGRVGWSEAAARIADAANPPVVAIEAQGCTVADLAEHLPAIAAAAEQRGLAVVASLAVDDIDLVAGVLFGPGVQLLCAPEPIERVAALMIAGRAAGFDPHGGVLDTDRDRLRHLYEEVARVADILARLTAQVDEDHGGDVEDRRNSYDSGPGVDMADPQAIRQAIRARRLRDGFFSAGLFEDPAWDMLLDLFAAEMEGARVSVSSLCIAAAVAPTTALRWIAKMTEAGLLQRVPDTQDRRRAFMALTDRARTGMRGYLAALSRAGLGIA